VFFFFFFRVATNHLVTPFLFTFFPSSSPLCKTQKHTHTHTHIDKQKPLKLPILSSSKIQVKTKRKTSNKAPKKASKSKQKRLSNLLLNQEKAKKKKNLKEPQNLFLTVMVVGRSLKTTLTSMKEKKKSNLMIKAAPPIPQYLSF
jgi:hypothetical protein